jgi:hypothetical protein
VEGETLSELGQLTGIEWRRQATALPRRLHDEGFLPLFDFVIVLFYVSLQGVVLHLD